MNSKEDNELITMGMNLGLYTFAKLFSEGVQPSKKSWQIMQQHCAKLLEEQTGMPAEDLALSVQPVINDMLRKVDLS